MAIIGGGGHSANDPIYVDTLESLSQVLAGDYQYIAFPEVYNGPKVLDYRTRGWMTSAILDFSWDNDYGKQKNVYFNGWTILGLSIMDCNVWHWWISSSEYNLRFYDLIVKNMYILANRNDSRFVDAGYSGSVYFINCKFSMVLDAQNAHAYFFGPSSSGYGENVFLQCSFNVQLVSTSTSYRALFLSNTAYHTIAKNCLFNFNSIKFYSPGYERNDAILSFYSLNFCKVTGSIVIISSNASDVGVVVADSYCTYNAVEIATKVMQNNRSIRIRIPSGTNVIKSDVHVKSDGVTLNTVNYDSSHSFLANSSQYIDADYLNQHSFLVGTAPAGV